MSRLAVTPLLAILDSLAKGAEILDSALGEDSGDAGSVAAGAANNLATLFDQVDDADEIPQLIGAFDRRRALVTATALLPALQGARIGQALDTHYGGTGSLVRFLAQQDARVHPDLRRIGISIDAPQAFPPAVVALGTFAVSGAGAGTFTVGDAIDRAHYGKANVVVRTTSLIGAAAIVATLTLTRIDGTSTTQDVTIPGGTVSGDDIDVGVHGTDMFVACTLVTITGGTAGDAFAVRTEVERVLAL